MFDEEPASEVDPLDCTKEPLLTPTTEVMFPVMESVVEVAVAVEVVVWSSNAWELEAVVEGPLDCSTGPEKLELILESRPAVVMVVLATSV